MITHRNGLGLGPGRGAWIPAPPANTVLPAISGVAQQGETLSCSNGSWTNLPTSFGYQWKRDGVAIGGATANSYLLQAADVGAAITCMVTAFNGGGSAQATSNPTGAVLPLAPSNTALPAITGTAQEGETLSCSTGTWANSPTSYAYQWKRDGSNISGATSSTYGLVSADIGATITCAVVATNAGGSSAPATATGVGPVVPAVPVNSAPPAITGTAQEGETLSCSTGTWSNSPTSYAYQWKRDGSNISGAASNTYDLVAADVGATITCSVTASNAGGAGAPATASGLGPVLPAVPVNTVAPVASGTPEVGQTLSCTTGTWSNSPTSYAYQWRRDGADISGATASSYLLVSADEGALIDCEVTASNAGGAGAPADSNDLGPIELASRIDPITTLYGGRPVAVPQKVYDSADANAHDANNHPGLGPYDATAVQDGPWSDPATWGGVPPVDGDSVDLSTFHVVFDLMTPLTLIGMHVSGAGTFEIDPSAERDLTVETYINHGAEIIGQLGDLVGWGTTRPERIKVLLKPGLTGPGTTTKLGWMTMGPVRRATVDFTPILRAAATIPAGATSCTVEGLSSAGWPSTGAYTVEVMFPSTEWAGTTGMDATYAGPTTFYTGVTGQQTQSAGFMQTQCEVRQCTISGDTLSWVTPLVHAHNLYTRTHSKTGYVALEKPMVALLSRPIHFETDPSADLAVLQERAHMMHMGYADAYFGGFRCKNMGRTSTDPSLVVPDGSVIYDTNGGSSIADANNVRGRYGFHVHMTGPVFGRQVILKNIVVDADLSAPPVPGWAYGLHSSNTLVENCIAFNVRGAGFTWELGDEIGQCVGCLSAYARGDGFKGENYDMRHEKLQNHNGHQGVGYDMQSRQILMHNNSYSDCHIGFIYFQQDGDWLNRIPYHTALRLLHPFVTGQADGSSPSMPVYTRDTYGVEQSQIPDFHHNCGWGARLPLLIGHRALTLRHDNTPGLFTECHFLNSKERGFELHNYTHDYGFKDCWWKGISTSNGSRAYSAGTVSWGMTFNGMMLDDFQSGYVDNGQGFNANGVFIDTDFGNVPNDFFSQTYVIGGQGTTASTYHYANIYPSWVGFDNTPVGSFSLKLRQWVDLDSDTDLPDADMPNVVKGGAPDPGLPNPKPYYVVDGGSDFTTTATGTGGISYGVNIVDEVGPRWTPSNPSWSGSTSANFWDTRPFINTYQTGNNLAERVGIWDDAGTKKARAIVWDYDRLTFDYIAIQNDVTITGMIAGDITLHTNPAGNTLLEPWTPPFKLERIPLTALTIPSTAPVFVSATSGTVQEGDPLAHLLQCNCEHPSYSVVGGADAAQFEIVRVGNRPYLRWASNGVQDYETPADADANNVYVCTVRVSDQFGNFTDTTHTWTVTNLNDTPVPFFLDTFNRANQALELSASGQWQRLNGGAGSLSIVSNLIDFVGTEAGRVAYTSIDCGSTNMKAAATNRQSSTGWYSAVSITDKDNWIGLKRTGSSNVRLDKCVGGTLTTLQNFTSTYVNGEVLELIYRDGDVQAVISGVMAPKITVASPPPATTSPGIIREAGLALAQRFDDYQHEALPSVVAGAPEVVDGKRGHVSVDATSFALGKVVTEANVLAKDLVVVFVSCDGIGVQSPSTGWTILDQATSSSAVTGAVYYHEVATNATLPDLTITNTTSESISWQAYCLRGNGTNTISLELVGQSSNGSNTDLPAITPAGGTQDYLFMTFLALDNTLIATAPPSNMAWFVTNSGTNGSASASCATARMPIAGATTFNPSAFTHSSEQVRAYTLAAWY